MANITKNTAYIDYQAVRAVFEQSEFVKRRRKWWSSAESYILTCMVCVYI